MSSFDGDGLYALLPAFIRLRDQTTGGGVLRALTGVIAEQAQVVSGGLDQLYDDMFIETCAPWVVPYIGDLIGFTPLRPLGPGQPAATRAEVADTIGYRRRKGTLAMLEQLCSDVTGWPGMAVEFARSGKTCIVRDGQTILDAAEEHGVAIPFSCRQGQCGTCKTKLLAGNVRMDAEEGLDPYWKEQGFVLTCVGHADGAVKLDA